MSEQHTSSTSTPWVLQLWGKVFSSIFTKKKPGDGYRAPKKSTWGSQWISNLLIYRDGWILRSSHSGAEASVTNDLVAVTQPNPSLWPPRPTLFIYHHTALSGVVSVVQWSSASWVKAQSGCLRPPAKWRMEPISLVSTGSSKCLQC